MSLTPRDIIKRAMRMMGAVDGSDDPGPEEMADFMLALNTMKRAMFGTFIGPRLSAQVATGTAGQAENGGAYAIPANTFTLTAPGNPKGGDRFAVVDANLSFSTYACTVARNGTLLEGASGPLILSTSGDNRQWWFRPDMANWVREADFVTPDDAIEFPDHLIAYLPYMLAVVIAPEEGSELRADVTSGAAEGRQAFWKAYGRKGANALDKPIGVQLPQLQPQAQG